MSVTLLMVLLATYGLFSAAFALLVELAVRLGAWQDSRSSRALLLARLLPSTGALFLVLSVVAPAFMTHEPTHNTEAIGPALLALALLAALVLCDGFRRAWSACAATRSLLRRCRPISRSVVAGDSHVDVVDSEEAIVAVVGAWRPRVMAARRVIDACTTAEIEQVLRHEAAHLHARDNLKLLLQIASPDPLSWLPAGRILGLRWRMAVEIEADARAAGADPRNRVALASALIKVARLATGADRTRGALSMQVATDDVALRVRELLAPPLVAGPVTSVAGLILSVALLPLIAVPLYAPIHEWIETLVAFAR